jgi:hypothetical protein
MAFQGFNNGYSAHTVTIIKLGRANTVVCGSLSPQNCASSGCDWRNGIQIRTAAANILNNQLRTANKGWSPTPHRKNVTTLRNPMSRSIWLRIGNEVGSSECGNEPQVSIKCKKFLE